MGQSLAWAKAAPGQLVKGLLLQPRGGEIIGCPYHPFGCYMQVGIYPVGFPFIVLHEPRLSWKSRLGHLQRHSQLQDRKVVIKGILIIMGLAEKVLQPGRPFIPPWPNSSASQGATTMGAPFVSCIFNLALPVKHEIAMFSQFLRFPAVGLLVICFAGIR